MMCFCRLLKQCIPKGNGRKHSFGSSLYSKTCLKRPLNNRQNQGLNHQDNGSLMEVESIAECSHSAILLSCIKQ